MVICRPAGTGDLGYRMIARPLLERLDAVRGDVELVVLRPPTLDALRAALAAAAEEGTPYQIVHFDGHGVFHRTRSAGPGVPLPSDGEGMLVFEQPGGGAHRVSAGRVARILADAAVPLVVLNACQSGAVGKDLEAAVATRLLAEGVVSVVAMAYSVYAVAAAEFMAAFYERLFAGGTVTSAVTAGRQQLYRKPGRPSPKGDLPLADWVVPVHYLRRDVSFPQAVTARDAGLPPLAQALDELSAASNPPGPGELDATGGVFVGRDALFYELEAAARRQKVVLLVGPAGTGKTELAKGFGRWWRDTGGVERPEWVFWHSFEPGTASFGLDGVITKIGRELFGSQFALLQTDERRALVQDALTKHPTMLIWDNFESVRSMPDPGRATPALAYHQLGMVARVRGRLVEAADWYRKSLAIEEESGDRPGMAVTYHELGRVAQAGKGLGEAEYWYRKSLTIKEEFRDGPGMVTTFGQFGLLAEERGQLREALAWTVRCVVLLIELSHPLTANGLDQLAALTARTGMAALAECWRQVTQQGLPDDVHGEIESRMAEGRPANDR
jgi:tetratricopeptide (TPR) repeat protein